MFWHAGQGSPQSMVWGIGPSLGIMWETGHFWLLIVYLFTALDDITPTQLRRAGAALHPGTGRMNRAAFGQRSPEQQETVNARPRVNWVAVCEDSVGVRAPPGEPG